MIVVAGAVVQSGVHLRYKSEMDLEALRYPVGPFDAAMSFTHATRKAAIDRIAALPARTARRRPRP